MIKTILEQETFDKRILAECDNCRKVRILRKVVYRTLCPSCCLKGRQLTEEWKQKISEAHKGVKLSEGHKRNMSKNHIDQRGDKNHNYRGGRKAANNPAKLGIT